jgi:hypothetical protein
MDKGKQRAGEPPRKSSLPTPSDDSNEERGHKRKRGDEHGEPDEDEDEFTKDYDPNQDPEERRKIMRKSRALEREIQGLFEAAYGLISARANVAQRNAMT